jgi:hypothetical protein
MSKRKNKERVQPEIFKVPHQALRGDNKEFFGDGTSGKPWFSFEYICQKAFCMKKCSHEQFKSLSDTLRILSTMEWKSISSSSKETNGYEMIKASQVSGSIPPFFEREKQIMIFRISGKKGRIAGVRRLDKFYVLFIDHNFTLYDHGS